MAQDFAKRKPRTKARKTPARKAQTPRRSGQNHARGGSLRPYLAGVVSGVFLSFLGYLGTMTDPSGSAQEQQGPAQPEASAPKPHFDFYNTLTNATIETETEPAAGVEPAAVVSKPSTTADSRAVYVLQAGSFRQPGDADQRKAQLLLLGLEPQVEEINSDNGRWYRVYLGPFESHTVMTRARGLATNENIKTLLLKRSKH